jgi:hypothetical protein
MNKGNILFSSSERLSIDTPQPDGSVVKTSVFKRLGFYNLSLRGDTMVLKRTASASLIMSLYQINQVPTNYQDIS